MKLAVVVVVLVAGCTKPNPAVCCLDRADCDEVGISGDPRPCAVGLACVDHQCEIAGCAMTGCAATAPVCDTRSDTCQGCTESSQCSRFADTSVCDTASGGCVQCVSAMDCPSSAPVCDMSSCRGCRVDSECPSAACGDDGACIDEMAVVYLDAGGTDAGTCTRTEPCRSLGFGVGQTTAVRAHIVFAPGTYSGNSNISAQSTPASSLSLHGGGAILNGTGDNTTLTLGVSATIRDLEINAPSGGEGLQLSGGAFLVERIVVRQGGAIHLYSSAVIRDILIENPRTGILLSGGQLTLDRAVIRGGTSAIYAESGSVDIKNLLVYGTSDLAVDLSLATGNVAFSTVVDSGTDAGTGARAFYCGTSSSMITVRSSIVWAPGSVSRVPIQGCNMSNIIAGPTAAPGASNVDPQFVAASAHDYHLSPSSPARDAVDVGPATDFEGDARPQGVRFDIGADEAK